MCTFNTNQLTFTQLRLYAVSCAADTDVGPMVLFANSGVCNVGEGWMLTERKSYMFLTMLKD